jgi:hypothetical protein
MVTIEGDILSLDSDIQLEDVVASSIVFGLRS